MKELFIIFKTFFKIGILTFGGGLAMLPILQRELVENNKWITEETLLNYYAIGQCTPGIIAVNTATFVGYKQKGVIGAVVATFSLVCPSLIIIMSIAAFIQNFADYKIVQNVFAGIRIAVAALITDTVIKLWRKNVKDIFSIIMFVLAFLISGLFNVSPIFVVLFAIIVGLCVFVRSERKN